MAYMTPVPDSTVSVWTTNTISNNLNQEWGNIRAFIYHLALEALGMRHKRYGNCGLDICDETDTFETSSFYKLIRQGLSISSAVSGVY